LILGNYASPTIQLWDVRTHCERMALKGLKSNLVAVTVSQDSLTLAAADFHGGTEQIVRASSERFERATVVALDPIVLLVASN
jgi:hypothetical protein